MVEFNTFNRQVSSCNLVHFFLNGFQVALGDRIHGKVVVEAAVNGGADGWESARVERHDCLSEQVGGGMPQDVHAFVGLREDAFHRTVVAEHGGQVAFVPVNSGGEAAVFFPEGIGDDFSAGDASGVFVDRTVRQRDVNHRHAGRSLNPYGVASSL